MNWLGTLYNLSQLRKHNKAPAAPVTPPFVPEPQVPKEILDLLAPKSSWKDPALPGMLTTIGAVLGQPRKVGQTGWGQVAEALAQGMNYRTTLEAMRQRVALEALDRWIKSQETAANVGRTRAETYQKIPAEAERAMAEAERARAEGRSVAERLINDRLRAIASIGQAEAAKGRSEAAQERNKVLEQRFKDLAQIERDKVAQAGREAAARLKLEESKLEELKRSNTAQEVLEAQKIAVDMARAKADLVRAIGTGDFKRFVETARVAQILAAIQGDPLLDDKDKTRLAETVQKVLSEMERSIPEKAQEKSNVWTLDSKGRLPKEAEGKVKVGDTVKSGDKSYVVKSINQNGTVTLEEQ